jgi:hypothetical protein
VPECDREASIMKRAWPTGGLLRHYDKEIRERITVLRQGHSDHNTAVDITYKVPNLLTSNADIALHSSRPFSE